MIRQIDFDVVCTWPPPPDWAPDGGGCCCCCFFLPPSSAPPLSRFFPKPLPTAARRDSSLPGRRFRPAPRSPSGSSHDRGWSGGVCHPVVLGSIGPGCQGITRSASDWSTPKADLARRAPGWTAQRRWRSPRRPTPVPAGAASLVAVVWPVAAAPSCCLVRLLD